MRMNVVETSSNPPKECRNSIYVRSQGESAGYSPASAPFTNVAGLGDVPVRMPYPPLGIAQTTVGDTAVSQFSGYRNVCDRRQFVARTAAPAQASNLDTCTARSAPFLCHNCVTTYSRGAGHFGCDVIPSTR